jgi:hypothetical protein
MPDPEQQAVTPSDQDEFLTRLVGLANRKGLGIGVVLQLHGTVVKGELCSATDYWSELAEQVGRLDTPTQLAVTARDKIATDFKAIGASLRKRLDDDESAPHVPIHIHLRNAVVLVGASHLDAPLWRGRLASVDGFSLDREQDEPRASPR